MHKYYILLWGLILSCFSSNAQCITCTSPAFLNSGLLACYPFANNANDESGNGYNGSSTNVTYTTDHYGNTGEAGSFNGTSSSVSIPSSAPSGLNTYTYSLWFKLTSLTASGSLYSLLSIGSSSGDQFISVANNPVSGSSGIGYSSYFTSGGIPDRYSNGILPAMGVWYHVALTRTSTTLKFYINGALVDTRSTGGGAYYGSPISAAIGSRLGTTQYVNGSLDNIRLYNRALTDAEVTQLYNESSVSANAGSDTTIIAGDSAQLNATGGITYSWAPSTGLSDPSIANPKASPDTSTQYIVTVSDGVCTKQDSIMVIVNVPVCNVCTQVVPADLIGCYRLNNNTIDGSGLNNNGIGTNITYSTDRYGNTDKAGSFNGTSSSVSIPSSAPSGLNTYTYSLWFKLTSLPASGSLYSLLSIGSSSGDQFISVANNPVSGSSGIGYSSYFTSGGIPDRYSNGILPAMGVWYHVALTRTSTTLKFYINGALVDTRSTGGGAYYGSPISAAIGSRLGTTQYVNGSLDNIRLYNRALTGAEVTQLFDEAPENLVFANAGNDTTIVLGDTAQLYASGGNTFSWSPTIGLNNPNIANPQASPTVTTQYIVTVSNGSCFVQDTVVLSVNSKEYYSKSTGALNLLSTWGTHPDGTGISPSSFDSSNVVYHVVNNIAPSLGGNFLINGSNSILVIGDGTNTFNLNITSGDTLKCDSVRVKANINITIQGLLNAAYVWCQDSSTVQYIGSNNQLVAKGSYYNFIVASSQKILKGHCQVRNNLTMFSNINCDTFTLTLGASTTKPGVLNRTSGTVIGRIQRWFAPVTNSGVSGLFPIGTSGNYRPLQLEFTSAPSTGGTLLVSFIPSNPGSVGLPLFDFTASPTVLIDKAAPDGYWWTSANGLNGGTYTITCTAGGFSGVSSYPDLRLLKRSTAGAWTLAGNAVVGSGSNASPILSRTGITSLGGEFAAGGEQAVNPLPVKWLSFTAARNGSLVNLEWSTASEINSDKFEVERSIDYHKWEVIGNVKAAGNSSTVSVYAFIDQPSGKDNMVYYRIKQLDKNGMFTHSIIQVVSYTVKSEIAITPNPASDFIRLTGLNTPASYEIFDVFGKAVLSGKVEEKGMIEIKSLAQGVYYIRLFSKEMQTIKFHKQ